MAFKLGQNKCKESWLSLHYSSESVREEKQRILSNKIDVESKLIDSYVRFSSYLRLKNGIISYTM